MPTIVLVGGNGYIGREITRQWLVRDPDAQIIVTSRTDRAEIEDPRVRHVLVDVNDAAAFEKALPHTADYVVNLTYGSTDAVRSIRAYAEAHGAQAIGNVGVDADMMATDFADFAEMRKAELDLLREGTVRVANYDLSIAYGSDRDDDFALAVQAGAFDDQNPVHVEVAARLLIDRLTRSWAA